MTSSTPSPTIVWFRQDLRIADQPALVAAAAKGSPVIPLFIWSATDGGQWAAGSATKWWLHHSLKSLDQELQSLGSRLIIREGHPETVLKDLVTETGANTVFWNRLYEPAFIERDTRIKSALKAHGVQVESHNAALLYEPWELKTKTGSPYKVFTPFSKACLASGEPAYPLAAPNRLSAPEKWPQSARLDSLQLLPTISWDTGFYQAWKPGAEHAMKSLKQFCPSGVQAYKVERDFPAHSGTSQLSPALHFGELSPRQIWHHVCTAGQDKPAAPQQSEPFLRQLLWREFAHHLLYHFPHTPTQPLREEFAAFPWKKQSTALRAWQRGQTGYPIVDAGMRELWTTGWMHNRVRMIVASFLVKDLLLPWQLGAEWFWDTLVDADLANNTLGWQWTAGCGADAAPYFRIFNPMMQSEKFDPDGSYIRRWIPELANLSTRFIHDPSSAPPAELRDAGIKLGSNYPKPMVDHHEARTKALEALQQIKKSNDATTD